MALTSSAVQNAFNTVFGRSATEAEVNLYANGSYSSTIDLQNSLYLEPEYALMTLPIARLYSTILDRAAEPAGVNYYLDMMRSGQMSLEMVAEGMIRSPEARAQFGADGGTDRAFVQAMYRTTLGREGEEQGVDYYVARLESGVLDRAGVALCFSESAEMVAKFGIRAFPALDGGSSGALVIPGVEVQSYLAFASGVNELDLAVAGNAGNFVSMSAGGVGSLQAAVDASAGMFNGSTNYVFMGGSSDGYLVGDTNFDGQADVAVTLVGKNSLDALSATDIV